MSFFALEFRGNMEDLKLPVRDKPLNGGSSYRHGTFSESLHLLRRLHHQPGCEATLDFEDPDSENPDLRPIDIDELLPHIEGIEGKWQRRNPLKSSIHPINKLML